MREYHASIPYSISCQNRARLHKQAAKPSATQLILPQLSAHQDEPCKFLHSTVSKNQLLQDSLCRQMHLESIPLPFGNNQDKASTQLHLLLSRPHDIFLTRTMHCSIKMPELHFFHN